MLGIWNGLNQFTLFKMGKFKSKVERSPGTDCFRSTRFHSTHTQSTQENYVYDSVVLTKLRVSGDMLTNYRPEVVVATAKC
jgi:hypothetical protein